MDRTLHRHDRVNVYEVESMSPLILDPEFDERFWYMISDYNHAKGIYQINNGLRRDGMYQPLTYWITYNRHIRVRMGKTRYFASRGIPGFKHAAIIITDMEDPETLRFIKHKFPTARQSWDERFAVRYFPKNGTNEYRASVHKIFDLPKHTISDDIIKSIEEMNNVTNATMDTYCYPFSEPYDALVEELPGLDFYMNGEFKCHWGRTDNIKTINVKDVQEGLEEWFRHLKCL